MTYSPEIEHSMRMFHGSLSEKDRRRYAAIEAAKLGHGGTEYISTLLGCDPKTIRQGQHDLDQLPDGLDMTLTLQRLLAAVLLGTPRVIHLAAQQPVDTSSVDHD